MSSKDQKILIVDDTESNIDILLFVLENEFDVSVALNGKMALSIIDIDMPDLILLDVMMPGIDGYEVCRQIKENPKTAHIPIVFLSALDEPADREKGLSLGAIDYITKPFDVTTILSRVREHFQT